MEEELDNCINFLDTSVNKRDNFFRMNVYRKKTNTGLYLNWNSLIPSSVKISLIKCLILRAYNICNTWFDFHKEFVYILDNLVHNGFPSKIVYDFLNKFLVKKFDSEYKIAFFWI